MQNSVNSIFLQKEINIVEHSLAEMQLINENNDHLKVVKEWRSHIAITFSDCVKNLSYEQSVFNSFDILVAKLYSYPLLPRNMVQNILTDFKNFYDSNFKDKLKALDTESKNHNVEVSKVVNVMHNTNKNHRTEHMALQHFKKLYFVEPKSIHVGTILESKR